MAAANAIETEMAGRTLRLTNLDKVLFPETGFTKGELIDHYLRTADVLLPHVRLRPLTLRRFPDGIDGPSRYEKCCPERRPDWFPVARVHSERRGEDLPYCVVDDLASLVWLANMANVELHPMLSRCEDTMRPTAMAFDLDPGAPAGVADCIDVALLLRDVLAAARLESFVKTSGGKGLHVLVPLNTQEVRFADTKRFARTVAEVMAERLPERVTANVSKAERRGRVLVDWAQNDRHKSIVSVYSLRARARPTVSMPVGWDELERARPNPGSLEFAPEATLDRLDRLGDLWQPLLTMRQELPAA